MDVRLAGAERFLELMLCAVQSHARLAQVEAEYSERLAEMGNRFQADLANGIKAACAESEERLSEAHKEIARLEKENEKIAQAYRSLKARRSNAKKKTRKKARRK